MFQKEFEDQRVEAFLESSAVPRIVYEALLQSIDCPVVIIDRSYRIKTIIVGLEEQRHRYIGKRCHMLAFNNDHPCIDCPVTDLFEKNELATTRKYICIPDEFEGGYEVHAYPLFDEQGNIAYSITAFRRTQCQQAVSADLESGIKAQQGIAHGIVELESQQSVDGRAVQPLNDLSKREIQVLRLMADGKTNSEIAAVLSISHHTVRRHTIHIYNKLGVSNRTQASVLLVDA